MDAPSELPSPMVRKMEEDEKERQEESAKEEREQQEREERIEQQREEKEKEEEDDDEQRIDVREIENDGGISDNEEEAYATPLLSSSIFI